MDRKAEIRVIARQLWEDEGRPEGRDDELYHRAEVIWEEQNKPGAAQNDAPPMPSPELQDGRPQRPRETLG